MAEKIKLNKNTLREQKQMLSLYKEFLPTLELRKQQLQSELHKLDKVVEAKERALRDVLDEAEGWTAHLHAVLPWVEPLVALDQVVTHVGNVAGVKVPVFDEVRFEKRGYSLVGTPLLYDAAIDYFKRAISVREEVKVIRKQQEMLRRELIKTTQRINLYEKVLIPETKENIRKIKVYLGDQQTAAVCRAKIAKGKLIAKALAAAAAGQQPPSAQ
jgi:V/A-type H+-transporting ATPase subunit D